MTKFPMTVQGARALEEELKHLKTVLRPQITQAIAEARELGDLKENAEYHAAREQQGMVEARIRDIEGRLQNAQVIDIASIPHTGKVIFGTTVDIANVETDEQVTYQIVGDDEADIKQGKLSVSSPIARAWWARKKATWSRSRRPAASSSTRLSRSVISDSPPPRAGNISWQLAQTFWVGGLWLLQFVVLPALDKIGLAPLLIEEIGSSCARCWWASRLSARCCS
ncbi:transcription elongation factor GreA [Pseudomonas sp. BAY1663]|nr:transcription elongation factor GreA [Pseudomonas sp. BAY1663]